MSNSGFQPQFHITNRMTAGLTRIERARGFLDAAKLSEDWLATMRSRAFLLEAHHTTHIEGTRQTLALRFLLEHGKLTIQDFEALCPGMNRRSLQRDLKALLVKRLATSSGATNRREYRLL